MPRRLELCWVTPMPPRRGTTAAQERWWALLARLARRHAITLVTFVDDGDEAAPAALPPGLAAVHRVRRAPFRPDDPLALLPRTVAGGFVDPALRAAVAARLAARRFDLVQYEFVEMARCMPPRPAAPAILTVHQVGFAQEGPLWRATGRPLAHGAVLLHRWLRELDFELGAVGRADHVVTLSAEDAARLRRFHPDLAVSVSPMGVDCAELRPPAAPVPPAADLVFVGHFGHPPNADAVRFLVRDVLPRVGRRTTLRVVGHAIPPAVAALASPDVTVVGPVPDVRPELAAARVAVAPVRFGTGMRGKVLEALGMGRPVVTTPVGAEGLGAVPGRDLLVADGAADFAAALRALLDDPALAARLGAGGRALAAARFDWDVVADAHDAIYERALAGPRRAASARGDAAALARVARRFGRWPAIAAGTALLATRALRWHLGRPRARVRADGGGPALAREAV